MLLKVILHNSFQTVGYVKAFARELKSFEAEMGLGNTIELTMIENTDSKGKEQAAVTVTSAKAAYRQVIATLVGSMEQAAKCKSWDSVVKLAHAYAQVVHEGEPFEFS